MPKEICRCRGGMSTYYGEHYTDECPIDPLTPEELEELNAQAEKQDIDRWDKEQEDHAYEAWLKSRNTRNNR